MGAFHVLILHISDIHFKRGEAGSQMDPNHHLRNELVRDAGEQCKALGAPPDAVLISGDIAFSGDEEEYAFAQSWFEDLCAACRCETSAIFVIPGNHDVQRGVAKKPLVQALHKDIKDTESHLRHSKLTGFLTDEDTGRQLYAPISNFNDFAAQYFCDLLPPDRTKVERQFVLNDGSALRVTGLNSAFVSSHTDTERSLFVDPAGFTITNEEGITHLVLCHHPYNWLANGQELADHLNTVAKIQLFGHEHTSRIDLNRDWVRVAASAAHPDKTERGWEPGYNLLELSVGLHEGQRKLNVKAHVRVWQQRPGQFIAKMDGKVDHFAQSIPLEPWERPEKQLPNADAGDDKNVVAQVPEEAAIEEDTSMTSLRTLSIKFFKLTFSQRLAIAGGLSLFEETDTKLPDHERFRRVLLRARDRHLLAELESEIDRVAQPTASTVEKEQ